MPDFIKASYGHRAAEELSSL